MQGKYAARFIAISKQKDAPGELLDVSIRLRKLDRNELTLSPFSPASPTTMKTAY
jgi:hypothetical protein